MCARGAHCRRQGRDQLCSLEAMQQSHPRQLQLVQGGKKDKEGRSDTRGPAACSPGDLWENTLLVTVTTSLYLVAFCILFPTCALMSMAHG
jgi:hypothetical protein